MSRLPGKPSNASDEEAIRRASPTDASARLRRFVM
jgi:hypothetical protein